MSTLNTTPDSTSNQDKDSKDGDDRLRGPELGQSLREGRDCSETQLLYLLLDKKAAMKCSRAYSSARHSHEFIKEVPANIDMHPLTLLAALGVDLNGGKPLLDQYFFYSWTRYPNKKAAFTRQRMTSDGHHCWSQGGGKRPIIKGKAEGSSQEAIGWKRKFKFVDNAVEKNTESLIVGSESYIFRLEEVVTSEDEDIEKTMVSKKQTPVSFLCVYRLNPIIESAELPNSGSPNPLLLGHSALHSLAQTVLGGEDLATEQASLESSGGQDLVAEQASPESSQEQDLEAEQASPESSGGQDLGAEQASPESSPDQDLRTEQACIEINGGQDLAAAPACPETSGGQDLGAEKACPETSGQDLPAEQGSQESSKEWDDILFINTPKHLQLYDQGWIGPLSKN